MAYVQAPTASAMRAAVSPRQAKAKGQTLKSRKKSSRRSFMHGRSQPYGSERVPVSRQRGAGHRGAKASCWSH